MKNGNNLPIISISLTKEEAKQFYDFCEKEKRGPSSLVRIMMQTYAESKKGK